MIDSRYSDMPRVIVVQKWEETEAGWGVRPDGYSLHASEKDRLAFIKEYQASIPSPVPHEYSRVCGTPYLWDADDDTYERVVASKNGLRFWNGPYPGSGGTDGWVKRNPS